MDIRRIRNPITREAIQTVNAWIEQAGSLDAFDFSDIDAIPAPADLDALEGALGRPLTREETREYRAQIHAEFKRIEELQVD